MKNEIKLNVVISILLFIVVLLATVTNLYYSLNALKYSLTNTYLESNNNYSNKLAEGTEYIIDNLQRSVTTMANLVSETDFTQQHLDIFFESENEQFNSIFITDKEGVIQSISPNEFKSVNNVTVKAGIKIEAKILKRAMKEKRPFISEAYETASGTILFLVTAPIVDAQQNFEGVMVGTLHLSNSNIMGTILGTHEYDDGSFVYAVDRNGHILYHPDRSKIFTDASEDPVVKKLLNGKSGYKRVIDVEENEYFAGYSYIESLGWGVITLTPTTTINGPLNELFLTIMTRSVTFLIILLIAASVIVKRVIKPLTQLAKYSEKSMLNKDINETINEVSFTKSHIYEINKLNHQVKNHLMMLNQEIQLDGLSGLANRRNFDATIHKWVEQKMDFSLVLIDVDDFKKINDHYGHIVGDDVIKSVGDILKDFAQNEHIAFRYGGEEFGLLLKGMDELQAFELANQIRSKIAKTTSPLEEKITLSLGVTSYNEKDINASVVIERADKALYQSKKDGKNRVTIFKKRNIDDFA